MTQDIRITPSSGEPQILFRGSGTNDTAIELNVLSSYESATGSGTALVFDGTQGRLLSVTDNLSSGTIYSVSNISGLPLIDADASGFISINKYGSGVTIYSDRGLTLTQGAPSSTTNRLYNVGGTLYFNGSGIGGGGGGGGDTYTAGTGLELSGTEFNIDSTVLQSGDNIGSLVNDAGYLNAHPSISAASSSDNSGRTYIQDVLLDANGHITGIATATETVTDTDTTYTAGTGLILVGTEFNINNTVAQSGDNVGIFVNDAGYLTSHPSISAASSSDNSGRTYIQDILLDSNGHITGISTAAETVVDTDTTYTAGTGLTLVGAEFNIDDAVIQSGNNISLLVNDSGYINAELNDLTGSVTWANVPDANITQSSVVQHSGAIRITESQIVDLQSYLTAHPAISAASDSDNSGRTYIQDILLDSNGHVTGIATATETVTDTDTTYTAGTGLTLNDTTFDANVNPTVQTTAAESVTSTANRTYAIQVNASDDLVVNVPWTAGEGGGGGDITSVVAGSGLSGGGTTGDVTLNVSGVNTDLLQGTVANNQLTNSSVTITAGTGLSNGGSVSLGGSVSIDVDHGSIDHDSLNNFVANEHIDHTSVTLTAGSGLAGGGDISSNRTFNALTATTSTSGITTLTNTIDSTQTKALTPKAVDDAGYGTMSSFIITDGSTPQTIDHGETITFSDGAGAEFVTSATNTVTVNSVDGEIDHDALNNFVANEHIDHTSVTLTAGSGLSGGGDISANRTFHVSGVDTSLLQGTIGSAQIANDAIDSQHYTDGSIDTAHIGDDQVTVDKLANSINTAIDANTAKNTNVSTNLSATANGTSLTVESSDGSDVSLPAATTSAWGVMSDDQATKLDGIEASADVTDVTNVTAAGALMDSELTDLAGVKGVTISTLQVKPTEGAFVDGDKTKLDGIAASANNYTLPSASLTAVGGVELATTTETTTGTDATRAVTPAGVQAAIDALVGGAPGALDTLNELAAAINDDASYASTITTALGTKAPIASPTFTGTVAIPNISNLETAVTANTAKVTNVSTDLGVTTSETTVIVTSSDGDNATIPVATTSIGGVMSKALFDKLDGIETSADVTDATNVTAAGALMDSEVTNLSQVKAFDSSDYATAAQGVKADSAQQPPTEGAFANGDKTKLDGIEASADVTDTSNVTAAGALMDSEVTNLAFVKALTKGISDGNVLTANDAVADNDFLRINGTEVEGLTATEVRTALNVEDGADVTDVTNVTAAGALMDSELTDLAGVKGVTISTLQVKPSEGAFADGDKTKLDAIEASADVTDTTNVTAAGALMDSELASIADVKALDQSVISGSSPNFTTANMSDASNKRFMTDAQESKLDGIEASATADQTKADIDGLAITTVGTIDTGVWNGTAIATTYIADNAITGAKIALGSDAAGDVMYYNGTDYVRLGIGTDGQVLTVNDAANAPQWEDASGGGGGISNVVEDTTPQLGGDLDLNGNQILNAQCEASAATDVALTAKGAASQSASFFEATDSSDTVVAKVYPTTDTSNFLLQKGTGDNVKITAKTHTTAANGWAGVEIDSDGQAYLELDRGGTTDWADIVFRSASSTKVRLGLESYQSRFSIYDYAADNYILYAPYNGTDVTTDRAWHFNKAAKGALKTGSDGATITFDLDEANTHTVTLGGNRTLALSNADVGQKFIIRLTQDGTGSRTVTWFSTIKWPGGVTPTLTTTANKTDVFGFICTSTNNYDGFVVGYNL